MDRFGTKVQHAQQQSGSDVMFLLNPQMDRLPLPVTRMDDPFFPFGKAVIRATIDLVCGYVLDLASYLALGAAGAVALERTIRYIGPERAVVLHGPFYGYGYTHMADQTGFAVDALTLVEEAFLQHYLDHPPGGALAIDDTNTYTIDTYPAHSGIYRPADRRFEIQAGDAGPIQLRLTTDDILYAGKLNDYPTHVRSALENML